MKLILVLLYIAASFVKNNDLKKYLNITFSTIGIILPIIGSVTQLRSITFFNYEFFIWTTFWATVGIFSLQQSEVELKKHIMPLALILIILNSKPNYFTFIVLELIFVANVLYVNKTYSKSNNKIYFMKFLILYFINYKSAYPDYIDKHILPILFGLLVIYSIFKVAAKSRLFEKFYAMATISFAIHYTSLEFTNVSYLYYFLLAALCLFHVFESLSQAKLIPSVKLNIDLIVRLKTFLNLRLNSKDEFIVKAAQKEEVIVEDESRYPVINFKNDTTSAMLINLILLLTIIMFYLYRLK